jgi:hypothetical protein
VKETLVFIALVGLFYLSMYGIGTIFNTETNNLLRKILEELEKRNREVTNANK